MKNHVIDTYENYKEENRLTSNQARSLEFITTARVLDALLPASCTVLDCAAGTGIYAFWLAEKGHTVTATDITPRHIAFINKALETSAYSMKTAVLDATDLSIFEDESFDVVLNMGPFYHLITEEQRKRCLSECLRVLKKGGLLLTAYIPKYYVFQYVVMRDMKYLNSGLAEQLVRTGVLRHDDDNCFWTDTYYSSKEEMESLYIRHKLTITDHFAQDGLAPLLSEKVNHWNESQFKIWCDYHYSICREPSLLGSSNHVMLIGKKQ